ncbi:MAG: hypothetical protein KA149_06850 [Chitinophagales bacterium]|nr:hypothetical protein [Chitinophagales bacterium]
MLKKTGFCLLVLCVLVFGLWGCGKKPYACIYVEGNEDSLFVNKPVVLSALCSTGADQYNWQINNDSVYFNSRINLRFAAPGQQNIYLLVTSGGKSASMIKKITIKP